MKITAGAGDDLWHVPSVFLLEPSWCIDFIVDLEEGKSVRRVLLWSPLSFAPFKQAQCNTLKDSVVPAGVREVLPDLVMAAA